MRFDKTTMLYIIQYEMQSVVKQAQRSYREFHQLFLYMKEKYPQEPFPHFPQKKLDRSFLKQDDVSDRITRFQKFLKFVVLRNLIDDNLLEFLNPNSCS